MSYVCLISLFVVDEVAGNLAVIFNGCHWRPLDQHREGLWLESDGMLHYGAFDGGEEEALATLCEKR